MVDTENATLQVLLEEFKACRDEIQKRLEAQDRLLSYIVALMAGTVATVMPLREKLGDYLWIAILALAIPSSLLGLMSTLNDMGVAALATYIEEVLHPNIQGLTGRPVLQWESFWRQAKNRPVRAYLSFFRPVTYVSPALAAVSLFIVFHRHLASTYEWSLAGIDMFLLGSLILGSIHTAVSYKRIASTTGRPVLSPQVAPLRRRTEQITAVCKPLLQTGCTVLDFGAGTGGIAAHLSNTADVKITAVDVVGYAKTDIRVVVYNGIDLPYPNKQFDAALAIFTLHHCIDPPKAIAELTRVTRHRIVVIEDVITGPLGALWLYFLEFVTNRVHSFVIPLPLNFKRPAEWITLFNNHGWKQTTVRPFKSNLPGLRHVLMVFDDQSKR